MSLRRIWKFIWKDDSPLSWLVSIILAFLIVKFLIFPALSFILGTSFPIVAVVSGSMEHVASPECVQIDKGKCSEYSESDFKICGENVDKSGPYSLEEYWKICGEWYEEKEISIEDFKEFPFNNGFNKGDVMILIGKEAKDINIGDVVVFDGNVNYPIIHRVVRISNDNGEYFLRTKGDNNQVVSNVERKISEEELIGKAVIRLPLLGWIKIRFTEFVDIIFGGIR